MNLILSALSPTIEVAIWSGFIFLSIIGLIVLIACREKFVNGKDK